MVMWIAIASVDAEDVSSFDFWSGIHVWIRRPHIVNRRIFGIDVLETFKVRSRYEIRRDVFAEILRSFREVASFRNIKEHLMKSFEVEMVNDVLADTEEFVNACGNEAIFQLRNMLPKCPKFKSVLEAVLIGKTSECAVFSCMSEDSSVIPPFPYHITRQGTRISLSVAVDSLDTLRSHHICTDFLRNQVLPRIVSWSKVVPKNAVSPSLNKVSMEKYSAIYNHLKATYGKKLIDSWPEKTDPVKFVYEDIAIAAYLMTLWEEERVTEHSDQKQSFVDLGCGNGLLVHILSSEGYPGLGIDIRKRNVWNFYGPNTRLVEKTIMPSDSMLFPEYDWIIGNHSDELTPWIPVIAARSSYKMRSFLLPCCPYTFNGKYDRQNSSSSRYQSYLKFIEELCQVMGFNVRQDKLRIPSTKRVCFICSSRNYEVKEEDAIDQRRTAFIQQNSNQAKLNNSKTVEVSQSNIIPSKAAAESSESVSWSPSFAPRRKIEPVHNCSALDPAFIQNTVVRVVKLLLRVENFSEVEKDGRTFLWNRGGILSLRHLANELGHDVLHELKSQCGGLQTLMRNHSNIFKVEKAMVSLADPTADNFSSRRQRRRFNVPKASFSGKLCLFYFCHPNGCPLSDTDCKFSHKMD